MRPHLEATGALTPSPAAAGIGRLAVIIPAYKGAHLEAMLDSFAAQTDRRFRIYVADDASPENLAEIVAPFRNRLDLVYHRFPQNLGQSSLVNHWDRAINLSDEEWIWLFSDDDLVSPDCVQAFWTDPTRQSDRICLLRFHSDLIDADGKRIPHSIISAYPPEQSWDEHILALTKPHNAQLIMIQNIIFPRALYRQQGGFRDYRLGMWTDIVTWADWARVGGIHTLPFGRVSFRVHPSGFSGNTLWGSGDRREFIRVAVPALNGLIALFQGSAIPAPRLGLLNWFGRIFRYGARPLTAAESTEVTRTLKQVWPHWPVLRDLVFWWHASRPFLRHHPVLQRLAQMQLHRHAR